MSKKKVALIIDSKGWAFDNIANNIKKYIEDFEIDIIPGEYFEGNMIKLFLFCKDYDLIHFMWRGYLSLMTESRLGEYANSLGIGFEEFLQEFVYSKVITFSVCDELYLDGDEKWRTDEIIKYANAYFVTSTRLFNIYNEFNKKPVTIIHDGVNLDLFKPSNLSRLNNKNRSIVIGWVGNSKFVDSSGDSDMKGVEGIIKPAVEELKRQNYNVSLNLADRNIKKLEVSEMPKYYNSIDIYVCASKSEGTPMPILEAMAMGLPVISTDVGIVQEAFGNNQKKYILKERNIKELVDMIKKLIDNSNDMVTLSQENLKQIKQWDWRVIANQYKEFFEKNLD